jgi:UDP-N-acetylmuramoylalanine--D-glutamate ligase
VSENQITSSGTELPDTLSTGLLGQSPASSAAPVDRLRLDPAWQGARALVVGLGDSGLAMAKWLALCGATVTVVDSRALPPQKAILEKDLPQAKLLHATLSDFNCEEFDLLAWSPGLSIETGESATLYERALAQGLEIQGELDLFLSALASQRDSGYRPKLLGVTGTNGKTTVTALTAHLCQAAGMHAKAAGNIGPSMLDAWMRAGESSWPQVWILELSSFQIAISKLRVGDKIFDAATVLNVTQDHLDWHASMVTYQQAKLKLMTAAKVQIVGDDASLMFKEHVPEPIKPSRLFPSKAALAKLASKAIEKVEAPNAPNAASDIETDTDGAADSIAGAHLEPMSATPSVESDSVDPINTEAVRVEAPALPPAPIISRVARFLSGAPASIGDFGLVRDGSLMWLAAGTPGEEIPTRRKGVQTELIIKRLMPADALKIRGRHNHLNVLASLALCRAISLPLALLLHGLRDYQGEPHRCELVAILDDVEYIDDSKGTNVGATVAGLLGLAKPCHLILGGEGKGQDFAPLVDPVKQFARTLLMIGRDGRLIAEALAPAGVETVFCETLAEAVSAGAQRAKTGEAVLLSPACASFDMFKSYVHRGQVFKDLVAQRAQDRGQIGDVVGQGQV